MKFIIGLGNPGRKYKGTRHNLGQRAVEELAKKNNLKFRKSWRLRSLMASGEAFSQAAKLVIPLTYMNLSGAAVIRLVKSFKIDLNNLLVVCDDINLDLGKIRIKPSGSDGGHNGLKSIIDALGTNAFSRLRIGIGRTDISKELSDFVLSDFTGKEEKELIHSMAAAQECIRAWLVDGIGLAMSKFN